MRTLLGLATLAAVLAAGCADEGGAAESRRPDSWATMNEPLPEVRYEERVLHEGSFSLGGGIRENVLEPAIDHGTRDARVEVFVTSGAADSFTLRFGPCEMEQATVLASTTPLVLHCAELDGPKQQLLVSIRAGAISGTMRATAMVPAS